MLGYYHSSANADWFGTPLGEANSVRWEVLMSGNSRLIGCESLAGARCACPLPNCVFQLHIALCSTSARGRLFPMSPAPPSTGVGRYLPQLLTPPFSSGPLRR